MKIWTPAEIEAAPKWDHWFVGVVDDGEHLDICEIYPDYGYGDWDGHRAAFGYDDEPSSDA